MLGLERVGDVLEEDQPQDYVLVLGRVHVISERVGGGPAFDFKAEVGGGVGLFAGRGFGHRGVRIFGPRVGCARRAVTAAVATDESGHM